MSESVSSEMFGPTLPPTETRPRRSSGSDSSDAGKKETKHGQNKTNNDEESSVSAKKMTTGRDERGTLHRSLSRGRKITRSRDSSSSSSSKSSSRSRSSSGTSSTSVSKTTKKSYQTRRKPSAYASQCRKRASGMRRSRSSNSRTKFRRKRVRRSGSSSSRSGGSNHHSKPASNEFATSRRSRQDRFEARNDHRRDRQGLRRDSHADKTRPRKNSRNSRSHSLDRSRKPLDKANRSSHSDHKEFGPTRKSDVHKEIQRKPLTGYSSSDDDRANTSKSQSSVTQKSSTANVKVKDDKKPVSGNTAVRHSDGRAQDTDSCKTENDGKPKETLQDMELFLKQLKANKQKSLKK